MVYDVLGKEIKTLPQAALSEVMNFIQLIKSKFPKDTIIPEKSCFGIWKNNPFYMSTDFDALLEDFAEYM